MYIVEKSELDVKRYFYKGTFYMVDNGHVTILIDNNFIKKREYSTA